MSNQIRPPRPRLRPALVLATAAVLIALVAVPAAAGPRPTIRPGVLNLNPTPPEGIEVGTLGDGSVRLDWGYGSAVTDVADYVVRRNGKVIAIVDAATLTYVDSSAGNGRRAYTVETVDTEGRRSGPSDAAVPDGAAAPVPQIAPRRLALATPGYSSALRRYPYLTDVVDDAAGATGYATVNWATDRSATTGAVTWGQSVAGACTPSTRVAATKTAFTVNGVGLYQWKAMLTLKPDTAYCYRVALGAVDLLGTDPSPVFRTQIPAGSTQSFSFAVLGDWGVGDDTSSNPYQAAVLQQLAASGVRFAVTTGDNAYSSGSQDNYGDLVATGPNLGGVFGPSFWTVAGASVPIFPAMGNHGFLRSDANHPHLLNFPQDRAVASSGGRYQKDTYCCVDGTASLTVPSTWYAFDAGSARVYILQDAWSDSNGGANDSPYQVDADYQWTPTSPQYQWLQQDLAAHPGQVKMAVFHYPLYSDQKHENSDTYLQGPNGLQGLLDRYGVKVAFNGHAHIYERNRPDAGGMASYVTGGGGAALQSVGEVRPCLALDAYALGWSNTKGNGNACGSAQAATSIDQVYHFLKVTVTGSRITVTPIDSQGRTFDVQTY
jgi:hypothetical protein